MLAIYKKEFRSYFTSLFGYVFIGLFLAIIGLYFCIYNIAYGDPQFERTLSGITFTFIILVPLLTMRVMSEESRQKTDQLLLTAPVSTKSVIFAKYLAVMSVFGVVMLASCLFPLILSKFGTINLASSYAGIIGFYLLGGTFMAIGLFVSACTDNQFVACGVTVLIVLLTTLMEGIASFIPNDNKTALLVLSILFLILCLVTYFMMHNMVVSISIAAIGEVIMIVIYAMKPTLYDGLIVRLSDWLSVTSRYDAFAQGSLDVSAILYYLSCIFIFLFLADQSLNKRRWY